MEFLSNAEIAALNETERSHYLRSRKRAWDEYAAKEYARAEGRSEGIEIGFKVGMEKGLEEVAKKMLLAGMERAIVEAMTGLTAEEVERLRERTTPTPCLPEE